MGVPFFIPESIEKSRGRGYNEKNRSEGRVAFLLKEMRERI